MQENILNWLDGKVNYVSCKTPDENVLDFRKKLSKLLFSSRVHFNDLEASDCYIIKTVDQKIDYELERPSHYRYNFENFNMKRNEYVYDKINMACVSEQFSVKDTEQTRAEIMMVMKELKHRYKTKNTFIEKLKKYNYKKIFFDVNSDNVDEFVNSATDNLRDSIFDFRDFDISYVSAMKKESKGLEQIGIFYPVVLNHDILEEKHYIIEINHLKFQRKNENFFSKVDNFFRGYGVSSDRLKDIMSLEEYFTHPGFQYSKNFAYFDPFNNYEKYRDQYNEIENRLIKSKYLFEDFIVELYDLLNQVQFGVVEFQHGAMLNFLKTKRSVNRTYSLRELATILKNKLEKGEFGMRGLDYQKNNIVLHCLINQDNDFKFTKNTIVDDLRGVDSWPIEMKELCQLVINYINMMTNKHHNSNLQYIYDFYNNSLLKISKKFDLKKKHHKVLSSMLLDLIFFYDKHEKLSKPYNSQIANFITKHTYRKYDDLIDFRKMDSFIQTHKDKFERYHLLETENENGVKEYIITYGGF